jgi:hypothetical protein
MARCPNARRNSRRAVIYRVETITPDFSNLFLFILHLYIGSPMDEDWAIFECPTLGLRFSLKTAFVNGLVLMQTMQGLIVTCPFCEQAHFYSAYEWLDRGE